MLREGLDANSGSDSMWRPVNKVVEMGPLAMCDVRSVAEEDWEPVDKVFDNWVEDSMYLKRSAQHRWYWLSNQTKDEVSVFSLWDSLTPHDKRGERFSSLRPKGWQLTSYVEPLCRIVASPSLGIFPVRPQGRGLK